ncbi:MAG TPA: hypothetical protein VIL41_06915 [Coriobacteriia bacterium]
MPQARTISRWLALAMLAAALWPTAAWAVAVAKPLNAVSFSDSAHGYIAGSPNGVDGVLSWTHNGGDSWHASLPVSNLFMGAVYASVDGASASALARNYDRIYESADSGVSWSGTASLLSRTDSLSGMAHLSGNRRVVVGNLGSGPEALIASSVNNAAWAIDFHGPVHTDANGDPVPTRAGFSAIDAAPGGSVAWAVGNDWTSNNQAFEPLIYVTANGGSSWARQAVGASTPEITCVAAGDAQTAFIGRRSSSLLRTTDGGSNWGALPITGWTGTAAVNAIDASDADHVLVVGDGGRIAWSSNASAATPTWSVNTTTTTNTLLGVQMIDASNWIVVGDNETILRTADGGASWVGSKNLQAPTVAITSPDSANVLASPTISIHGTSSDGRGVGVAKVEVRVQRGDGLYLNPTGEWVVSDNTWIQADPADPAQGLDNWGKDLDVSSAIGGSLTVWARATDGLGLVGNAPSIGAKPASVITPARTSITINYHGTASITGTLRSGGIPLGSKQVRVSPASSPYASTFVTDASGNFAFTVAPSAKVTYTLIFDGDAQTKATAALVTVVPKVKLNTPVVPRTVRHTRSFKVYSDMYPKHASGGRITFYFQRYLKVRGHYTWVAKKTVSARAVTYRSWSRGTVLVRLAAGKWRVQSKHSDADHATTYSAAQKYFTVR